jgi:SAM-dependent methyltransferase
MTHASELDARLTRFGGRREQWDAVAGGWGRQRPYFWDVSREVGTKLVDALAPLAGETILELAAGPGDTGFVAAARLAGGGRLISTDVSPEMVAVATQRGHELGLDNVDYRVVDAQAIDLPDASVDGALCRFGYMLVPEPARALAETHRVLRAGGRVSFAVWGEAAANPWGTAVGRALVELDLIEKPDPDAPGPFRLGDVDRLRSLVRTAGFDAPAIEDVHLAWRHESFDRYWAVTSDLSFVVASATETLPPDVLAEVKSRTADLLGEYTDAQGRLSIPGLCRNVLAHRA